jgi:hypothetical protein
MQLSTNGVLSDRHGIFSLTLKYPMHLSLAVVDRYYFNIENVSKKLVIIGLFRKAGIKPQPAAAAAVV